LGRIYRWADEKGTVRLTDDGSEIPERYADQGERIDVQKETLKGSEKTEKQEGV
jgi:hypothetical protein